MSSQSAQAVLLVLTSHEALGQTGTKTGSWLEELASSYWTFVDAGYSVELASTRGGSAPIDPMSLEAPWLGSSGQRFMADSTAKTKLAATQPLEALDASKFAAVYLVGGAGTAYDFPGDAALGRLVSGMFLRGAPVAAVCHGTLGLLAARDAAGRSLVNARRVTGVSNAEEAVAQYDKILPMLPENALTRSGGKYSAAAEPFAEHVVEDENLLTGQNPASAAPLARAVLARLKTHGA